MSWLNNVRISSKIVLIISLLAILSVGAVGFAATRMLAIDSNYSTLIDNVSNSATLSARASRWGMTYVAYAYKLLSETTDEGNQRALAAAQKAREEYATLMATVAKNLPEQSALIGPVVAKFEKAFVACQPSLKAAAATTSEDNAKAAVQMRAECESAIDVAAEEQGKLVAALLNLSNQGSDELTVRTWSTIYLTFAILGAGLVVGLALAMFIGVKGLARPIDLLKTVMEAFANGDLKHDVPGLKRHDEVGEMAKTVEVFKINALEVERMRREQEATKEQADAQRKADMHRLADGFEAAVGEIVKTVSSASTELEASASTLTMGADRSQQLATSVAAASEQASTNVQSVASATEELSTSVGEIGRRVQESARMAGEAVGQARSTTERVSELSKAAARIGDVVELINTIAGQTNLLALNATIEAARAGEAGRGFAVVASEVKALAEQTAKATGEIGQQISGIQAATHESVVAIKDISSTIERLSEISSAIAAAVEEQGAATREISRNVQQAAQGTQQVSSNIIDVQRGASETGSASSQLFSAAQSLSSDGNRLKVEVDRFLTTVRAA
ncbi:methyl-accepting chemotaxis protein [Bradyrhizobium sp. UFLA05-109]